MAFGADGASEPHGGFEVRVYINDPGGTAVVVDRLAPASDKGSLAVMYDNVYYGQLVFHTDGTYTFQSAQVEATLYIGIGTQDADGSESQTTGFTLNLSGGDEPPPPLEDVRFDQIVFDEAHLAAGTKPDFPGLL